MAVRLIKIDRSAPDHWDFAKRNGFWDLLQGSQYLEPGDTVVFWVGGSPGTVVGRATVTSELQDLPTDAPHAWSATDSRRGHYEYRVDLTDFEDIGPVRISYGDGIPHGFPGRSNNVTAMPDRAATWLWDRLGVAPPLVRLSYDDLVQIAGGNPEEGEPMVFDKDTRERLPMSVVIRRGSRKFRNSLAEVDGPLLEHGLKGLHGRSLMVLPSRVRDRPDPELLAQRYQSFKSA